MPVLKSRSASHEAPRRAGGAPAPLTHWRWSSDTRPSLEAVTAQHLEPVHREEYSTKLLQPLVRYLDDVFGADVVDDVARSADLTPEELWGERGWISLSQFHHVLATARSHMETDAEFLRACRHRLREAYGPVVLLLRATSVQALWEFLARTMRVVSRVSHYEIMEGGRTWIRVRYFSEYREDRIICLSRHSQVVAFPTLWGLPAGELEEGACIARGDPYCEYLIRWHDQPRWRRVLAGLGLGAGAGALLGMASSVLSPVLALSLVGGLLGYVLELRRANQHNLRFSAETNQELHDLTQSYAEAMEEVLALNQRQRDWSRLLEERVTERTASFLELVERIQRLGERRETTLRSLSHDLRSPLTVLKALTDELRNETGQHHLPIDLMEDMDGAVARLEMLIRDMLEFGSEGGRAELVKLSASDMPLGPIVDRLRRRLRALVLGRDIRVSVFANREAPEEIETDVLVFDRILDNLLTNAAKYTEAGSIVVELTGSPGILTVKVSDTGPGISDERIEHVFKSHGTPRETRLGGSYGMGLAIVVRLLDQVGGRLEVMSKPNMGTTFWAHFPVRLPESQAPRPVADESIDEIVGRVVTIRRLASA